MSIEVEQIGLYDKYVVSHADGSLVTGRCFVLKPETDLAARVALRAYARATVNEELKLDIGTWLWELRLKESEAKRGDDD